MQMSEATYSDHMREAREADDRGDLSLAYHLYGLAAKTPMKNGRPSLEAWSGLVRVGPPSERGEGAAGMH